MTAKPRIGLAVVVLAMTATVYCSGSPEQKEARYLITGKKFLERKDHARAILQFKNAARVMPKDAEPYYQLGLAYLEQGALREALASLNRALQLNPKHAAAQLKLAQLMARSGSKELVEEAESRLRNLATTDPTNANILEALGGALLRLGKLEEAEKQLQEALKNTPAHLKSSVDLATVKMLQKDTAAAEAVLKKAVQQAPRSVEAALALGQFYLLTRRPELAEAEMQRALQIDPKSGPALVTLGALQLAAGQKQRAEQTYRRASELRDARYRPLLGIFLFQQGRRDEAIREFNRLTQQDPADRVARSRLVAAYIANNQTAEAEKLLAAAIRRNPKDTTALLERGALSLQAGKDIEAQKDLQEVLHYQPDSPIAHYTLARVYGTRGRSLLQRQQLEEALRLQPNLLAARLDLASALVAANSAKSALQVLDQTPAAQKRSPVWMAVRNWVLLALGDEAAAREGIRQSLAIARTPDLILQEALLKVRQKDFKGALLVVDELLNGAPDDTRGWQLLAEISTAQNQFPQALERLRRAIAKRPGAARLQYLLGTWLMRSQQHPSARAAFLAAKAADSRLIAADIAVAELDMADGQTDSARRVLNGVISVSENLHARLLLAMLEEREGQRESAIAHYRAVVQADDRNVIGLNNLAYLLVLSNPSEALKYAQKAAELSPNVASVQDTIGWAYYHNGMYDAAVRHLKDAVAKENTGRRMYHLGMAYLKRGDREVAEETLRAALKMDPKLITSEPELRSIIAGK